MNQEEQCDNVELGRNSNATAMESDAESMTVSSRGIIKRSSGRDNNYLGLQMREQDADWLEAMHVNGGPNKTGMTPVLTSTSSKQSINSISSSSPPPSFSLLTDGDDTSGRDVDTEKLPSIDVATSPRTGIPSPTTMKRKNKLLPFLSSNSPKIKSALQLQNDENIGIVNDCTTSTIDTSTIQAQSVYSNESSQDRISMFRNSNLQNLDVTHAIPTIPLRKAISTSDRPVLSGTIYEEESTSVIDHITKDMANSSITVSTKTPAIQACNLGEKSAGNIEQSSRISNQQDDLKSYDDGDTNDATERRKLTEVAQFADAVGDNAIDLHIIEDDDDQGGTVHGDDDDDDDATEIHVQKQQRNVVGGLLPIKVRSNNGVGLSATAPSETSQLRVSVALPINESSMIQLNDEYPETPVKLRPHHVQTLHTSSEKLNIQNAASVATTAIVSSELSSSPSRTGFLAQLPTSASMCASHDFVYKGIGANPPEIVKRGTTRGNYAQLHRKAWLEVTDKYHRYGKNLRLYYRYWESEGHPTNIFFDWLDSKGEAAGNELPEIKECPRRQLDSDTVLYITNPAVTQGYAIQVIVEDTEQQSDNVDGLRRGRMYDIDGQPVCTGPDGWIFVLRDNVLYGAKKVTSISGQSKQRFHHSSFFGGKAVAAAGIFITDDDGYLTRLYPHSGHYRPGEAHMQRVLFYLYHAGVDLRSFEMDTQQIMHVARDTVETNKDKGKNGNAPDKLTKEKKKKIEALHLLPAVYIACFLAHKARFIGEGIFAQIHQIRQSDVASVSEALAVIDQGGFWRKSKRK